MPAQESSEFAIGALRAALPYLRIYRGKVFVVKIGGAVCGEPSALKALALDLGVLRECGIHVVLVHGAGPQTTELSTRLGIPVQMVGGRRVTCQKTRDVAVMTMNGTANTSVLAACRATNLSAIGISGVDAACIKVVRRAPKAAFVDGKETVVDFGYVGDVIDVDPLVFTKLLDAGFMPVVSTLAADDQGTVMNINADTVAARIAKTLGAEKLVFMTEAPGILEDKSDPTSLVSYLDVAGLDQLVRKGAIDAGMLPKVEAIKDALTAGVPRVHVISDRKPHALLVEVFTNAGCGTLVVPHIKDLSPAEQTAAPAEKEAAS